MQFFRKSSPTCGLLLAGGITQRLSGHAGVNFALFPWSWAPLSVKYGSQHCHDISVDIMLLNILSAEKALIEVIFKLFPLCFVGLNICHTISVYWFMTLLTKHCGQVIPYTVASWNTSVCDRHHYDLNCEHLNSVPVLHFLASIMISVLSKFWFFFLMFMVMLCF